MRKRWSAGVSTVLLAAVALFAAVPTQAADHLDSPRTQGDASADINDVYVFRGTSADLNAEDTTVLIMTVFPQADAVMRKYINDLQFGQGCQPDGRTHIIGEYQKGAAIGYQSSMQGHSV